MSKQENKSKEAKRAIISAAIVLFAKRGYKETTIKDLCEESGYSVGAFYHHFKSKADILAYMYNRFDRDIRTKVIELAPKTSREGILLIAIEHVNQCLYLGADATSQYLGESLIDHNSFSSKTRLFEEGMVQKYLETGIESGEFSDELNVEIVTRIISSIFSSHVRHWCLFSGQYKLMELVVADIEYLLSSF
ncbi:TetR/AcrR family transcriptional regulator [Enterococcus sp. LJL99]